MTVNANPYSRPARGHQWDMFIKIAVALGLVLGVLYLASEWHKGTGARVLAETYDKR